MLASWFVMEEERIMTRQEVWAVYERGARRHSREFIVMYIDTAVPEPVDTSAGTERMEMAKL
jgi:RNase P protein component